MEDWGAFSAGAGSAAVVAAACAASALADAALGCKLAILGFAAGWRYCRRLGASAYATGFASCARHSKRG